MSAKDQKISRREAIKRIALATVLAGVAGKTLGNVTAEASGMTPNEVYINYSKYSTYASYADPVYVNYSRYSYYSIQYYNSYSSHSYYIPPPR